MHQQTSIEEDISKRHSLSLRQIARKFLDLSLIPTHHAILMARDYLLGPGQYFPLSICFT